MNASATRVKRLAAQGILLGLVCLRTFAAQYVETEKAIAADRARYDGFGQQVDMYGDIAVAAASHKDEQTGVVYVYKRSGPGAWEQLQVLSASDKATYANFGTSVRIERNRIVVGAEFTHEHTGAAYVFIRDTDSDTFHQVQRLTPDAAQQYDNFGHSVALAGNRIVVGACGERRYLHGAAYVFERQPDGVWSEAQKLVSSQSNDSDGFGSAVALDDQGIYVGAPTQNGLVGAVYAFTRNGTQWVESAIITADAGRRGHYFGISLASFTGGLAIGATGVNGFNGAVYIFSQDGHLQWGQTDSLFPTRPGQTTYAYFGSEIDIYDTYMAIAAPGDFDSRGAGYLYTYQDGQWRFEQRITSSEARPEDSFGRSIGITPTDIIAGAPREDHDLSGSNAVYEAGAVYFFRNTDTSSAVILKTCHTRQGWTTRTGRTVAAAHGQLRVRIPHGTRTLTLASPLGRILCRQSVGGACTDGAARFLPTCAPGLYVLSVGGDDEITVPPR